MYIGAGFRALGKCELGALFIMAQQAEYSWSTAWVHYRNKWVIAACSELYSAKVMLCLIS